jgi:sigma-E factor negative regulatory protein RseA
MNDVSNEQLSALMDGELPSDEVRFLLRRIDNDAGLAQRWSRYQIVSAVLKRQYAPSRSGEPFAVSVMARLDGDAVAPMRRPLAGRLMRWAGGGAIAASVAVFALVATRPGGTDGAMPAAGAPTVAAIPAAVVPQFLPIAEMPQPLPPQQVLPAGFSDYSQPVPSYAPTLPGAPRDPNVQSGNGLTEGFVPYVLVVGARQKLEPQPPARRNAPSKQQ